MESSTCEFIKMSAAKLTNAYLQTSIIRTKCSLVNIYVEMYTDDIIVVWDVRLENVRLFNLLKLFWMKIKCHLYEDHLCTMPKVITYWTSLSFTLINMHPLLFMTTLQIMKCMLKLLWECLWNSGFSIHLILYLHEMNARIHKQKHTEAFPHALLLAFEWLFSLSFSSDFWVLTFQSNAIIESTAFWTLLHRNDISDRLILETSIDLHHRVPKSSKRIEHTTNQPMTLKWIKLNGNNNNQTINVSSYECVLVLSSDRWINTYEWMKRRRNWLVFMFVYLCVIFLLTLISNIYFQKCSRYFFHFWMFTFPPLKWAEDFSALSMCFAFLFVATLIGEMDIYIVNEKMKSEFSEF